MDFFSTVPSSTGTASSGLSVLGRSAGTWVQICGLSQHLSGNSTIRIRTICATFRQRIQTEDHSLRPSLYLQSNENINRWLGGDTIESTHRSYAVVVLKDTTKPRATPSTVRSWLLSPSLVFENLSISTTTGAHDPSAQNSGEGGMIRKRTHPLQQK